MSLYDKTIRDAINNIALLSSDIENNKLNDQLGFLAEASNLDAIERGGMEPDPFNMTIMEIMDYSEKHGKWAAGMRELLKRRNPRVLYDYAYLIVSEDKHGGFRWPEAEPIILTDPETTYLYCQDILRRPWRRGEEALEGNPELAAKYALNVSGKRSSEKIVEYRILAHANDEAKKYGLYDSSSAIYCKRFLTREAQDQILVWYNKNKIYISQGMGTSHDGNKLIISESEEESIGYDWYTPEEFLSGMRENPRELVRYARAHAMTSWPEAEPYIATNPRASYEYASEVLKKEFPAGVAAIIKDPILAFQYARSVMNRPYEDGSAGEASVKRSTNEAIWYAIGFKKPWEDPCMNIQIVMDYPKTHYFENFKGIATADELKQHVINNFTIEEALNNLDMIIPFCKYFLKGRWYDIEEFLRDLNPRLYKSYEREIVEQE